MSHEAEAALWHGFPLIFAGLWMGIGLLLSWIGGWQALAGRYRATQPFTGERFWMKSAAMGSVGYRNSVNLGADSSGLYLAVFPLFRVGHPPLFIPWSDISFSEERRWLLKGVRLQFREAPVVSLLIPTPLATRIFAKGPLRLNAT